MNAVLNMKQTNKGKWQKHRKEIKIIEVREVWKTTKVIMVNHIHTQKAPMKP